MSYSNEQESNMNHLIIAFLANELVHGGGKATLAEITTFAQKKFPKSRVTTAHMQAALDELVKRKAVKKVIGKAGKATVYWAIFYQPAEDYMDKLAARRKEKREKAEQAKKQEPRVMPKLVGVKWAFPN